MFFSLGGCPEPFLFEGDSERGKELGAVVGLVGSEDAEDGVPKLVAVGLVIESSAAPHLLPALYSDGLHVAAAPA